MTQAETQKSTSRQEVVTQLATAMSASLESIIEGKEIKQLSHNDVTDIESFFEKVGEENSSEILQSVTSTEGTQEAGEAVLLIQATTIEYGQTLIEANSDIPGPVLAEMVTGPLKGARLLGTFTEENDYLIIEFNTAVKDGESYSINAIVLDPETTLPAVVTNVDKRWLRRVILPTAASFISGLGAAIAETSNTNVTVSGDAVATETTDLDTEEEIAKAVEEAADKISEIIDEEAEDIETLVVVKSGTPIGILFLEPVFEAVDTQQLAVSPVPNLGTTTTNSVSNIVGSLPQSLQNIPGISTLPVETIQGVLSGNQ